MSLVTLVCVCMYNYIYVCIIIIIMCPKTGCLGPIPLEDLLLIMSVICCLFYEFKYLLCGLLHAASCY